MAHGVHAFEDGEKTAVSPRCPSGIGTFPKGADSFFLGDSNRRHNLHRYVVENFVGTVEVPVGLAGPLQVSGEFASGEYRIPLATTEAALVASYSRGAKAITEAGGCNAVLLAAAINRAPGFAFDDLPQAHRFVEWASSEVEAFRLLAEASSSHIKLVDMKATVEGNHVYLNFSFTTGEAAGQNMITFATAGICDYINASAPTRPRYHLVEANHSGDKKASTLSFAGVRGKRVSADIVLPSDLVRRRLAVTPEELVERWRMGVIGSVLSGTIGVQGHFANGLAALYIACGQDAACIAESAVGVTRFELTTDGDLYSSVTLPNIVVGTVGGGTQLPSQRACLDIIGLSGPNSARALAEICAALCLAGELSLSAAMCANTFARAHRVMARRRTLRESPSRTIRADHGHDRFLGKGGKAK